MKLFNACTGDPICTVLDRPCRISSLLELRPVSRGGCVQNILIQHHLVCQVRKRLCPGLTCLVWVCLTGLEHQLNIRAADGLTDAVKQTEHGSCDPLAKACLQGSCLRMEKILCGCCIRTSHHSPRADACISQLQLKHGIKTRRQILAKTGNFLD